jgi:hypothetical protein
VLLVINYINSHIFGASAGEMPAASSLTVEFEPEPTTFNLLPPPAAEASELVVGKARDAWFSAPARSRSAEPTWPPFATPRLELSRDCVKPRRAVAPPFWDAQALSELDAVFAEWDQRFTPRR